MDQTDYVRLIISDVHLGSAHTKEKELIRLLMETQFDEQIVVQKYLATISRTLLG
mgnify:CR=1 FL=1